MRGVPFLAGTAAIMLAAAACSGGDGPSGPMAASGGASVAPAGDNVDAPDNGEVTLDVRRMTGNVITGAPGAIRGLSAGGVPWRIDRSRVRLTGEGRLRVEVRGLVFATGPAAGTNPVPQFRAVLSCLVENAGGTGYDTINIASAPVPATTTGDATVDERLSGMPARCLAPVVFVTSPGQAWFAVTE